MEENLNNQTLTETDTEETPVERSLEEQLEALKGVANKERAARKEAERKAAEYSRKMTDLEGKFNSMQQQMTSFLSLAEQPTAPVVPVAEKRQPDPMGYDINYQQAAKQVVSDLQAQLTNLKGELESEKSEKNKLTIEAAVERAFVEAGGIFGPDAAILDIVDPDDYPIEVIKRRLIPRIKKEGDEIFILDRDGKVEFNKNGNPLTLREKIELLKPAYASIFRSDNNNKGMGTPLNGKNNGIGKTKRVSLSEMRGGKIRPEDVLKADYFVE